ncbi:MAG: hypothetical protein CL840_10900 [Crocinitomicaceae bacterium]|nr:hypothetical protein [Crocinitomicaceae bacterium]|tara:strand:+ start:5874 stop:6413 length:540 start_codon:yes stop_codon:yes gene_type:complete
MENPTILHLIAFLYIGFAKLSNNEIPIEEEMAIKRKIAEWLDLSYKNVDQYEMVMRETLEWFNSVDEKIKEDQLMAVAGQIAGNENMDIVNIKRVLSEIRDIAVSNGKFDRGEKKLHDKIAAVMGVSIVTVDEDCAEPVDGKKKTGQPGSSKEKSKKNKGIGFRYGKSEQPDKKSSPKK